VTASKQSVTQLFQNVEDPDISTSNTNSTSTERTQTCLFFAETFGSFVP